MADGQTSPTKYILIGCGITFSCIALIFNALARSYDFFTYYFTLLVTPMGFVSGVFFPLHSLPVVAQRLLPRPHPRQCEI